MEHEWVKHPYEDGDEDRILELWKAVYPKGEYDYQKWLKWWNWMYNDNPVGKGIIWVAEDNNKIVGQYAIIPILMKIGAETITGAQSIDTMTHPDYRHQGIFETLAKAVFKEAAIRDIQIIYGFPGQFSHSGFISKLNWFDVQNMQIMLKPFNWRNTLKRKMRNRFLRIALAFGAGLVFSKLFIRTQEPPNIEGLTITRITCFDKRFNEFWPSVFNQSKIMVVRNRDYLNWRYISPDTNYSIFAAEKDHQIYGYIVLQHKLQNGIKMSTIFDLMAQSEEIMHCLIFRAIQDCRQNGSDAILYYSITNNTYRNILKRNGFISLPFIKGGYFSAYSSSPSISKELLSNPQNWLVQTGDSDAV